MTKTFEKLAARSDLDVTNDNFYFDLTKSYKIRFRILLDLTTWLFVLGKVDLEVENN